MPPERRAALLLLGLAVAGQVARSWLLQPGAPPGEFRLTGAGPARSPAAHKDSALRLGRPVGPGERIDLDRASAVEIARLPRVGLRLARTIEADRAAHGPFGSLEALDRVPGIGPGLLRSIASHVRFSAASAAAPIPAMAEVARLDLNSASAAELERLPFVGPVLAQRIVAWRERHGPFPSVDSLVRVPGIGPATVRRLAPRLRVAP